MPAHARARACVIRWITERYQEMKRATKKDTFPPIFMFQSVPVRARGACMC